MRLLALAILFITAPLAASAQEEFYVDFGAGSGNTDTEQVTGAITLASGIQGPVSNNQILSYTLSSGPGDPIDFTISGEGAAGIGPSLFTVQGNDLLFTPLPFVPGSSCHTCDNNDLQETGLGNASRGIMYFAGPGFDGYPGDHGADGYVGEPGGMSVAGYSIDGNAIGEGNWPIPTDTVLASAAFAPEFDASGAAAGLTLLAGLALVLIGHRRVSPP